MIAHLLALAALLQVGINYFLLRIVHPNTTAVISQSVAILVPMRNEEENVADVLDSVLSQSGLGKVSIAALDDNSTDKTATLLADYQSKIAILNGSQLPQGWLGKNYALHQLTSFEPLHDSTYLVFIDADVRLAPTAIASSIALMESLEWDFISPYPREDALSLMERLIQPLLQWSWLASIPLRRAENGRRTSMIVANGQFFIVKSAAYRAIGGHESIKSEVLDDLQLARTLVSEGFIGGVADGSEVASCRMYKNQSELVSGYTKSLWKAFGSPLGSLATLAILTLVGPWPLIGAITGDPIALLSLIALIASRAIAARRTHSPVWESLLHPLGITVLIYLIALSWWRKRTGELVWKGRLLS